MRPPRPAPESEMPLASDRLVVNHCGTTAAVGMKRKPTPMPKRTPCVRKRCQISVAKLAQIKLAVSRMTPQNIMGFMPHSRTDIVAMGDTSNSRVMLRDPTKAYSKGDEPGKVLCFR